MMRYESLMYNSEIAKLKEKLSIASKCPYHSILPIIIGPDLPVPFNEIDTWLTASFVEVEKYLRNNYSDAFLFPRIEYVCFCPECANKNPTQSKHNRFGYGYTSQESWNNAINNWNKACIRSYKRLIMNDLKNV